MHAQERKHVDKKRRRNNEAQHRFNLLVARFQFRRSDEYWVYHNGKRFSLPLMTDEEGRWMPDYQGGINRMFYILESSR